MHGILSAGTSDFFRARRRNAFSHSAAAEPQRLYDLSRQLRIINDRRWVKIGTANRACELVRVKRDASRPRISANGRVMSCCKATSKRCFTDGDNSKILPTDTMKNTVYSLARKSAARMHGRFCEGAGRFSAWPQSASDACEVAISREGLGAREIGGKPHPTTFVQSSGERQTTKVQRRRAEICQSCQGWKI